MWTCGEGEGPASGDHRISSTGGGRFRMYELVITTIYC